MYLAIAAACDLVVTNERWSLQPFDPIGAPGGYYISTVSIQADTTNTRLIQNGMGPRLMQAPHVILA